MFSFNFSFGDLLVVGAVLLAVWRLYGPFARFMVIMREFPPHKHVGEEIVYPSGMAPDEVKGRRK